MIQKLNLKLRPSSERGIFHDSRKDAQLMIKVINRMSDKIDELVESNNILREEIKLLKKEL